jgi:hypothetical protein
VRINGEKAGHDVYKASKILAERAAWQWIEENGKVVDFDITVLIPPVVRLIRGLHYS